MRLRHRVLLLVIVLVGLSVGAMAVLATYLIDGLPGLVAPSAVGPVGGGTAGLDAAVRSAAALLWLGALALGVVLAGLGIAAVRLWLVAPVERAASAVAADLPLPLPAGPAELVRLVRALTTTRADLAAAQRRVAVQFDSLSRYRAGFDETSAQLVVADRLALTGQLALGLAHELGGPIGVAMGALDLITDTTVRADRDRHMARVDEAVARMDSLVAEFAAFGAPLAHGSDASADRSDAVAVTRHVLALSRCHRRCRAADVRFATTVSEARVALAAGPLEQILLNLIVNGADAIASGGHVAINLEAASAGGWWLHVDDDGPGVPADQRSAIFDPFVTTKPPGAGSGLGLAVSRGLARAVGGDVTVGDAPIGGARFSVHLPAADGDAALH